jgi:hypothetical protein
VFLSTITSTPYSPNRLHVDQNVQSSLGRVGKSCIAVYVLGFTDAKVTAEYVRFQTNEAYNRKRTEAAICYANAISRSGG